MELNKDLSGGKTNSECFELWNKINSLLFKSTLLKSWGKIHLQKIELMLQQECMLFPNASTFWTNTWVNMLSDNLLHQIVFLHVSCIFTSAENKTKSHFPLVGRKIIFRNLYSSFGYIFHFYVHWLARNYGTRYLPNNTNTMISYN